MSESPVAMNEPLMKQIAHEAAKEAITELFLKLGIDISNPIEVQKDMQSLRAMTHRINDPEVTNDMAYLRELRLTSESIKSKTLLTFVGILVAGLVSTVVVGIKSVFADG